MVRRSTTRSPALGVSGLPAVAAAGLLALAAVALGPAMATAQEPAAADADFRAFLPALEAATRAMLDGDAEPWIRLLSSEPGGTLLSPFGEVLRGRPALEVRYREVAGRFVPGPARLDVEYLDVDVSGDRAVVVALERSRFRPADADALRSGYTRVTMAFRREGGVWKLRHRHMDHLGAPGPP